MYKKTAGFTLLAVGLGVACSGSSNSSPGTGNAGGNAPQGGTSTATGGSFSGGMTSRAGSSTVAGSTASGGASVTGGTLSAGGAQTQPGSGATGGARAAGGNSLTGGSSTISGSTALGGTSSAGGQATAGTNSAMGGAVTGGFHSGGGTSLVGGTVGTGGSKQSGGTSSSGGNRASGGTSSPGGSSGNCAPSNPNLYVMGADLSHVPQDENGGQTKFIDTDGTQKDILAILKNHGFNTIRLRTFVDPTASDGYSPQGYCDLNHTITMAKRVKQSCMGFLLDLHYSDNWADPGKQCIPVAWQGMNLSQMTQQVHDYTVNTVKALVNAGARPDIVQVGNEITPGMLIHICDSTGAPTSTNSVNGSISNWNNLAGFLNAGIKGVHDVDPSIKIMLHIERGGDATASVTWINNALSRNVAFDVFGESTYVKYQGQPTVWQSTFNTLFGTSAFAGLKFASAEYNNEAVTSPAGTTSMRAINDTIFNMASNRGFGTFFWEPTQSGDWGSGLFTWNGTSCTAIPSAFAVYDSMRTAYASRL